MEYDKEIRDLKRRLDLAETKISQQAGQFEFISGQLRDVQLAKVDALPKVIAEIIGRR